MRPTRLVARGFAAFRDEVELDFTDTDFFALVGPTGAGKSSVIDAICFALYGSVPRYEDERVVTPVITTDATEARVELDFVSNGGLYRIVRVVRRKGAPKVQLDRLADDGELAEALTSAVREAKQMVTDVVGLSFDQFTKCVVLPQGAFASFLHAGEAERNKLLTSLLDLGVYDRIATLAGERHTRIDADIAADERVLADLGPVDDASLTVASTRLDALRVLDKAVSEARVEVGTLAERLTTARAELADTNRAIAALDGVQVAPELSAIASERDALVVRLQAAEQAHTAARAELESATVAAAVGLSLDERRAIVQAHRRLRGLEETRNSALRDLATHTAAVEQARAAATQSDEALGAARTALDDCRVAHAAHSLAAHLTVGEPCPVCEQVVTSLDHTARRTKPAALAQAETQVKTATKAQDVARRGVSEAEHLATRVTAQIESIESQRHDLVEAIAPIPELDAAEEALAAGEAAASAVDDARKRAGAALDEETAARRAVDGFDRQADAIGRAFHDQRDAIAAAGVSGAPVPTGQLAVDWTALHEWSISTAKEWRTRADTLTATSHELESTARDLVDGFIEPAAALGVVLDSKATIDGVRDAVREAGIDARHHHDRLVTARESSAKLVEQVAARRAQLEVTRALRGHLRTTNFKTWLLARAVDALAERATARLLELSGGRYELALGAGDDFEVVDRANAGERRPVRSLSGGETFEASLALALALAEQVAALSAAGASSLESIFLDEGFGTLDPEALELVAGAVETLGGEGRMVGIVTHVSALAERVPVRFRVANDGRTATITREG